VIDFQDTDQRQDIELYRYKAHDKAASDQDRRRCLIRYKYLLKQLFYYHKTIIKNNLDKGTI